jgi:hypothetical protein
MTRCGVVVMLLSVSVAGCVLPFGPGPIEVVTEDIRITQVSNRTLFGERTSRPDETREVIQFNLSSDTNIRSHLSKRLIQVRCRVDDGNDITFGRGPFNEGVDFSESPENGNTASKPRASDGRFSYTVYAFVDLSQARLIDGHLSRSFPLEPMAFSQLSCFIIGVTMAPVRFPRSNDFGLSREVFLKLLQARRSGSDAAENPRSAHGR